jgi:hypothetical protein
VGEGRQEHGGGQRRVRPQRLTALGVYLPATSDTRLLFFHACLEVEDTATRNGW